MRVEIRLGFAVSLRPKGLPSGKQARLDSTWFRTLVCMWQFSLHPTMIKKNVREPLLHIVFVFDDILLLFQTSTFFDFFGSSCRHTWRKVTDAFFRSLCLSYNFILPSVAMRSCNLQGSCSN